MFENGFDASYVFRHPVFLVTFIVAIPAWIVAFAAQCAAEAKYSTGTRYPVVGVLWFSIWIQLAITIHLFLALATDQLAIHRFQLAVVIAIAVVFAVIGVEQNIFSTLPALIAVGVGWLFIAMVDLVWLLYLTSEEDSTFYRLLTSGGTGGLSGQNRRSHRRESAAAFNNNELALGNRDAHRMNGGGYPMGGYSSAGAETTPQKAPAVNFNAAPQEDPSAGAKLRAKALYAYQANVDDPNEVGFSKGDLLEVLDNTGKWYQVKTPSGQIGIAPSNYLSML